MAETHNATVAESANAGHRIVTRGSPSAAQAILLGSMVAQLLVALLITVFLARVLSPAAFGFFSLVSTIFILVRKFLDLGMSNVAAREIAIAPRRERPILEGMMAYRRAAGVVLFGALLIFAFVQKNDTERYVLLGAAAVLLFTEPAALDPVFQVRQAQGAPAILNVAAGLLVLLGSVVLKMWSAPGADFAWLIVLREIVLLAFTLILAHRLLGYWPRPGFRGRELRRFFGPAVVFGLASVIYTIYFNCDVFFVYAMRGKDELGAYSAAFRPINPLLLLPWLLMVPLIPVMSAAARRDRDRFLRQVRGTSAIALGLGACALAGGTLLAPELVELLYRGKYLVGALSCVDAFRWLAVALGMVCITTVTTAALLADGKEKTLLAIGTSALLVNVVFNLVALRRHNFTAAGLATAVTELFFLIAALVAFKARSGRGAVDTTALLLLLPGVVLAALLRAVHGGATMRVACGVVLGIVAFAAILLSPVARRLRHDLASEQPTFRKPFAIAQD